MALVVRRDRQRTWAAIAGILILALLLMSDLASGDRTGPGSSDISRFIRSLIVLSGFGLAMVLLRRMLIGRPVLCIDETGVVLLRFGKIPWEDIASIEDLTFGRNLNILFRLHEPEKHRRQENWYYRLLVAPSSFLGPVVSFALVSPTQRPSIADIEGYRPALPDSKATSEP